MQIYKKIEDFYNKLIETRIIYFLIGFSILISYYLLYIFRSVDNTVLMSWNLVFYYGGFNIYELLLILSIAIIISFLISRINIFSRYNEEKYHILFLFISGMIISSLFWNIPEINCDAARFFTQAKYLEIHGIWNYLNDWGHELFAWTDYPSVTIFYGLIFRYLGEYREYIQAFNTILFSLTLVLTYKISKRLWNEEIALYSGLLLMSFPYLLSQIPLMLVDIPLMFLTILSAYLIFKIFDNPYYTLPASLVVFFIVYAKITSVLMIIPAISILAINYRLVIKNKYRWIFTTILSMVLVILFFLWKGDVFIDQIIFALNGLQKIYEPSAYESSIKYLQLNYLFQMGAAVILLAVLSLIIAFKKKDMKYLILITWVIIPFLMFHDTRIRYMIPVFPFIAAMASLSLYSVSDRCIRKFLISSIVLTSIIFSIYAYIPFEENFNDKNIKNAAEFTNELNISEIQIFLDFSEKHPFNPEPLVSLFDIYSIKKIIYSENNKFYPVNDYSNSWTSLFKIPSFYQDNISSNSENSHRIIVIFSDNKESISIPQRYLENHIFVKKYESKTFSILTPSSVKIYLPQSNSLS